MNFVDLTLLKISDPALRGEVFDEIALEQIVAASYFTEGLGIEGPYNAVFDRVEFGLPVADPVVVEGTWSELGNNLRTEARFLISGLVQPVRVDAVWKGSVVARMVRPQSRVIGLSANWPVWSSVDAEIAAGGPLPVDPAQLEQQRRLQILVRLREGLNDPDSVTDEALTTLLNRQGYRSVGEWIAAGSAAPSTAVMDITFGPPADAAPAPEALPVTVAVLIREADFSLAASLAEARVAAQRLDADGPVHASDVLLRRRRTVVSVLVVPKSVFDDAGWPGGVGATQDALRASRRAAAAAWLAREGVVIAGI